MCAHEISRCKDASYILHVILSSMLFFHACLKINVYMICNWLCTGTSLPLQLRFSGKVLHTIISPKDVAYCNGLHCR